MSQSTANDPQQVRVYQWEADLARYDQRLDFSEFTSFVRTLECEWGLNQPEVRLGPAGSLTCFDGGFDRITVAENQIGMISALHETAHHIKAEYELLELDEGSHGPIFVRLIVDLYSHHLNFDEAWLTLGLGKRRIKVGPPGCITPPLSPIGSEFSLMWAASKNGEPHDTVRLGVLVEQVEAHQEACRQKLISHMGGVTRISTGLY